MIRIDYVPEVHPPAYITRDERIAGENGYTPTRDRLAPLYV